MSIMQTFAQEAVTKGIVVKGVKGESVLSAYIDIVVRILIDCMHCVLLGVVKQLLEMWLDSANHSKNYYIAPSQANAINQFLSNIKPPDNFRIKPRSLNDRAHWKASEYRAWLLYYSLPVLIKTLPGNYVHHYALLVCSMHVLLNDVITVEGLRFSQRALNAFYKLLPTLYGEISCSANMHALIHLPKCVARFGPLWAFSMFGQESFHSELKRRIHGTRNVLPQITKFMKLEYLHDYFTPLPKLEPIVGKIRKTVLLPEEIQAFSNVGIQITEPIVTFRVFQRIYDQLHACNPKSVKNGSICEIEPGKQFISIKCFCQTSNDLYAIGYFFTNKDDVFYDTSTTDDVLTDLHLADSITHRFFYLVDKLQQKNNVIVVNTKSLLQKCIHVPTSNANFDVVIPLVNVLEHH